MSLTPRKDERAALVELLESEDYDDADQLAGALLRRAYELIQARGGYVVHLGAAYGPFATEGDATREATLILESGRYAPLVPRVVPLLPAHDASAPDLALDRDVKKCSTCKHPKGVHEHPKQMGNCVVGWNTKKRCACKTFTT